MLSQSLLQGGFVGQPTVTLGSSFDYGTGSSPRNATYPSMSAGSLYVFGIVQEYNAASGGTTGMTVAGNAATLVDEVVTSTSGGNRFYVGMYSFENTVDRTNPAIVTTFTGTMVRGMFATWEITNIMSPIPRDTATNEKGAGVGGSVSLILGADLMRAPTVVIFGEDAGDKTRTFSSFTGVTEDFDRNINSSAGTSCAGGSGLIFDGAAILVASSDTTDVRVGVAGVWR